MSTQAVKKTTPSKLDLGPNYSSTHNPNVPVTESPQRTHNLKLIASNVNEIRTTKDLAGMKGLLWKPSALHPDVKNDEVTFTLNEKLPEDIGNNIYASAVRNKPSDRHLVGRVDFDIDIHKPLLSILDGAKTYLLGSAFKSFQDDITKMYLDMPKSAQMDKQLQQSFLSTAKMMNRNYDELMKTGDFKFRQSDESMILHFILAHEMAHISFKEKHDINFQLMEKAKLPSSQSQKYLSNALLNLNRYLDSEGMQHEGANYSSTRDEIHSDAAGVFTAAYLHLKKGNDTSDIMRVFRDFGKLRNNLNNITSVHQVSTHESSVLFSEPYLQRVVGLAQQMVRNPSMDAKAAILDVTEDAFFDTLKKRGIIIKRPIELDSRTVNIINSGQSGMNSLTVYEKSMQGANMTSKETYENCHKNASNVYKNSCLHYLNSAQKQAVDPDNDKRINQSNLDRALVDGVRKGVFPGVSGNDARTIESNISAVEAEALTRFAEMNNISIRTTNQIGGDFIHLDRNSAVVKFR